MGFFFFFFFFFLVFYLDSIQYWWFYPYITGTSIPALSEPGIKTIEVVVKFSLIFKTGVFPFETV